MPHDIFTPSDRSGRNPTARGSQAPDRSTRPEQETAASGPVASTPIREVTGGVRGWRGWRLTDVFGEPRLQSLTATDIWQGPIFTADAPPNMHQRQRSGVHAYATPGQMASMLSYGPALAYGEVTLYGQVCRHEGGYRAEHARIDRLYLRACGRHRPDPGPPGIPMLLALLAQRERATVHYCGCRALTEAEWLSYDELEALAAKLGDTYQCDVTIDTERPRGSFRTCPHSRQEVRPPTHTTPRIR